MSTGKKILVVDDDRVILTFASKLLTRSGHEVVTAGDGFEALNVLPCFLFWGWKDEPGAG